MRILRHGFLGDVVGKTSEPGVCHRAAHNLA